MTYSSCNLRSLFALVSSLVGLSAFFRGLKRNNTLVDKNWLCVNVCVVDCYLLYFKRSAVVGETCGSALSFWGSCLNSKNGVKKGTG